MGIGILITAAAVMAAWCVGIMVRDSRRFVTVEYTVKSKKLYKDCKAVMLSDLHNKEYGKENSSLVQAIDEIKPNFILIAGDMLTANEEKTEYTVPVKLIGELAERYPVYYGMGNHEYRMKIYKKGYGDQFEQYAGELEKCGVRLLSNERIYLPEYNMEICGLEIERRFYRRFRRRQMEPSYVEKLMGKSREDCFEVLLAHNPDYFREYAGWGADLTLAGHVHGGVVRVPGLGGLISPMLHLFPKYDGGLFEEYGRTMILGRGLGMHTVPVRLLNPGELVVIHMKSE